MTENLDIALYCRCEVYVVRLQQSQVRSQAVKFGALVASSQTSLMSAY